MPDFSELFRSVGTDGDNGEHDDVEEPSASFADDDEELTDEEDVTDTSDDESNTVDGDDSDEDSSEEGDDDSQPAPRNNGRDDDLDSPRIPRRRLKEVEDRLNAKVDAYKQKADLFDQLQSNPALFAAYMAQTAGQGAQTPQEEPDTVKLVNDRLAQIESELTLDTDKAIAQSVRELAQVVGNLNKNYQNIATQTQQSTGQRLINDAESTLAGLEKQYGIKLTESEKQALGKKVATNYNARVAAGDNPDIKDIVTREYNADVMPKLMANLRAGKYTQGVRKNKAAISQGRPPSRVNGSGTHGDKYAGLDENARLLAMAEEIGLK